MKIGEALDKEPKIEQNTDFCFVTNEETIVKCAERAYREYNTIVNGLKESGIVYDNSWYDYAVMDNNLARSKLGIGWSSNIAQLAQSYYYTEISKTEDEQDKDKIKQLYDIVVIMAVVAQVLIDSSKREYEISGMDEIKRVQGLPCMQYVRYEADESGKMRKMKYDFPEFMRFTREVAYTKAGDPLPYDVVKRNKEKLERRINSEFDCPMNWLVDAFGEITRMEYTYNIPTSNYFVKYKGGINRRQITKLKEIVEEFDGYVKECILDEDLSSAELNDLLMKKSEDVYKKIYGIKMGLVTVNRIIELALGIEGHGGRKNYNISKKYARKFLNCLYRTNKDYFFASFVKGDSGTRNEQA